jgi:hypothetical protein
MHALGNGQTEQNAATNVEDIGTQSNFDAVKKPG